MSVYQMVDIHSMGMRIIGEIYEVWLYLFLFGEGVLYMYPVRMLFQPDNHWSFVIFYVSPGP